MHTCETSNCKEVVFMRVRLVQPLGETEHRLCREHTQKLWEKSRGCLLNDTTGSWSWTNLSLNDVNITVPKRTVFKLRSRRWGVPVASFVRRHYYAKGAEVSHETVFSLGEPRRIVKILFAAYRCMAVWLNGLKIRRA